MSYSFFTKRYSPLAEKRRKLLIERLNNELNAEIPLDAKIESQGANRAWLSSGRFKWTFQHPANARVGSIGSAQSVVQLLKCEKFKWLANSEILGYNESESIKK